MKYKPFLLSFTASALLAMPFAINAEAPPTMENVLVAPAPGQAAVVDGLSFQSVVLKHDAKGATIRVEAKNKTDARITTEVAASLMMSPSFSPMSRMVPPPREISNNALELSLAPGECFTKTLSVKLTEDVVKQLNVATDPDAVTAPNAINFASSAPSLYASVRVVPPPQAPVAQAQSNAPQTQQVASK